MVAHQLEKRANNVLNTNFPDEKLFTYGNRSDINITSHGSDVYWAVCAVMLVSSITFVVLSFTKPRSQRIFHYITALIVMVAATAYYSMASNLGWTPIQVEFPRTNPIVAGTYREIFYVRYIDWVITTPLLLMDLLLTAGLPWPTILFTVVIDEIMIVTGLSGALTYTSYKWGYYVGGMLALFWIAFVLLFEARNHANQLGSDVGRIFILTGGWTTFLWFLYPIAWGLAEGGNVISPDGEAAFYSVLDVCAKPIFGALLLWGHRNIDPARLGLHLADYAEEHPHETQKRINNAPAATATNGAAATATDKEAETV